MVVSSFMERNIITMGSFRVVLWVNILCFLWLIVAISSQQQEPQVPCFFIFGDSLVDNGNNNGILTLARANYRPYGIDFPQGTTGRFTNGRTYVDALGKLIDLILSVPKWESHFLFSPSYNETVKWHEFLYMLLIKSGWFMF